MTDCSWHAVSMIEKPVTQRLKDLRTGANVGVREMARRLGMSAPASYTHYEDPKRFKAKYLPLEWAEKFAAALEVDGVPRESVLALAGVSEGISGDEFEARLAKLSPSGREKVLQYLADQELLHAQALQSHAPDKPEEEP